MTGKLGLIELGLTLALVFGWGFWQLRSLKKMKSEDVAKEQPDLPRHSRESGNPSPEPAAGDGFPLSRE